MICIYLFLSGSLASTCFSFAAEYVWFSGQSWIHFMILNFWRGKPLDTGLEADSMKTRCSCHQNLMVENSPFATPCVLVGMWTACSCGWFPGTLLSQSFLLGEAEKSCPGAVIGYHFGNAVGDQVEKFELPCISQDWSLCLCAAVWLLVCPSPSSLYIWKVSGCLNSSFSYFNIVLGILYAALSDQWDPQGNWTVVWG